MRRRIHDDRYDDAPPGSLRGSIVIGRSIATVGHIERFLDGSADTGRNP
jgi:hypothetical protein